VVDAMMKELNSIPESEVQEIIRVGLSVLAGRVTTMNKSDVKQLDIFEREKFPDFVDLRIKGADGKYKSRRFNVKKINPNTIIMHTPAIASNKTASRRDNLIEWARRRVADGFGDVAVEASE
jgi:phage-related protein